MLNEYACYSQHLIVSMPVSQLMCVVDISVLNTKLQLVVIRITENHFVEVDEFLQNAINENVNADVINRNRKITV